MQIPICRAQFTDDHGGGGPRRTLAVQAEGGGKKNQKRQRERGERKRERQTETARVNPIETEEMKWKRETIRWKQTEREARRKWQDRQTKTKRANFHITILSFHTNKLAVFNTSWSLLLHLWWACRRQTSLPFYQSTSDGRCSSLKNPYLALFFLLSLLMLPRTSWPLCKHCRRQQWIIVVLIREPYIHQTIRGRLSGVTANAYDSQASVAAEDFCIVKHFYNTQTTGHCSDHMQSFAANWQVASVSHTL